LLITLSKVLFCKGDSVLGFGYRKTLMDGLKKRDELFDANYSMRNVEA